MASAIISKGKSGNNLKNLIKGGSITSAISNLTQNISTATKSAAGIATDPIAAAAAKPAQQTTRSVTASPYLTGGSATSTGTPYAAGLQAQQTAVKTPPAKTTPTSESAQIWAERQWIKEELKKESASGTAPTAGEKSAGAGAPKAPSTVKPSKSEEIPAATTGSTAAPP